MTRANRNLFLLSFILSICVIIPTSLGHIGVFDDFWKERAEKSGSTNSTPPFENPQEVINEMNIHVAKSMEAHNRTRRTLTDTSCSPTNPIDRCWRCDPDWEKNRKRLADCALGFGKKTTGGKAGPIYVVTDPSDSELINPKPGTLRFAVTRNGPLWIIFKHSMIIRLQEELIMNCDKTIDGRGANVQIRYGAGITIQFISNIIIHGIHVKTIHPGNGGMIISSEDHYGLRTRSDGDGISIYGSTNVWIDHVSMSKCSDGLIDAIQGSTAVTISNSHFTDHNEVMLFGASDSYSNDTRMQITVAFNRFGKRLVQRMPRARLGLVHVVNNDYTYWVMYAIGGSCHPTIISQGNRFRASRNAFTKEITKRDYSPPEVWKDWTWKSENDFMLDGAYFVESGPAYDPNSVPGENCVQAQKGELVGTITKDAGALHCKVGLPC